MTRQDLKLWQENFWREHPDKDSLEFSVEVFNRALDQAALVVGDKDQLADAIRSLKVD